MALYKEEVIEKMVETAGGVLCRYVCTCHPNMFPPLFVTPWCSVLKRWECIAPFEDLVAQVASSGDVQLV